MVEAYETVVPKSSRTRLRAALKNEKRRPNFITFTSSSTVRNFVALLGRKSWAQSYQSVGWGEVCFHRSGDIRHSPRFRLRTHVEASQYTIPGLIRALAASVV